MGHLLPRPPMIGAYSDSLRLAYYKPKLTIYLLSCNGFQNLGALPSPASQFWAKQAPNARDPAV